MLDQLITKFQARQPLPPLFPTQIWDVELSREIHNAPLEELSATVRAGLLLWNDDLEASHNISQGIHTPTGSFWHAIMHRREGDASNSLYWWNRTGHHAAFDALYQAILPALEKETDKPAQDFAATLRRAGTWRPDEFVGRCQRAGDNDQWLRRVQVIEMATLLRWCHQHGV